MSRWRSSGRFSDTGRHPRDDIAIIGLLPLRPEAQTAATATLRVTALGEKRPLAGLLPRGAERAQLRGDVGAQFAAVLLPQVIFLRAHAAVARRSLSRRLSPRDAPSLRPNFDHPMVTPEATHRRCNAPLRQERGRGRSGELVRRQAGAR